MYVYTKKRCTEYTPMGIYCTSCFGRMKFTRLRFAKTSANKRRLITIYMQRLLVRALLSRFLPTQTIPKSPLRCKITIIFTDIQKGQVNSFTMYKLTMYNLFRCLMNMYD